MNIVTPFPSININTANVYTETARRDNQLREVIPAPAPNSASNTETKAQSDADKAKLPSSAEAATYDATGKLSDEQAVEQRQQGSEDSDSEQQQNQQASEETPEEEQEQQQLELEQQQIEELKARDTEVRVHEQAHASVGGQYAGSPSYEYQRGPDGTNYAVGGEVQIDVSEIPGDPQATIDKMQTVRAAALAPAEPSSADRAIAADATQKMAAAQAELSAPADDEAQAQEPQGALSINETSTAESQSDTNSEQARDPEVDARAGRIANFYQMTSSPQNESGFSAFG
ncbi:putative metalloprotease CJM1_0395 family protein [Pseudoalteromonas sp. CST5]|uniref:putative metalloprotease CJM1_0395 family protein n=1 Tax=unclassified Pseudoalteromonas TaxID=194690 RepID=UPI0023596F91|nr:MULTISPECIES: putative metalloprotease CJM1_0395 family protein [unclassified Pseudoalteromonas]MDC9514352.1 putative metalloprotease CJM1_0395 family protein [Pseudoalteromonas sp. CST1]MDC9538761.1 putative metalloprotease CJM1_0395 family protein [Pseudoalteromonas sp. CST3]MDC9542976.1 putative metalloprotease CJM1_0395 family protein [Pseudoalteromonas sp. CST2]MDC9546761.1 putative metalloprotease CJM1_0395 family protein [Pseudoalteromonas sp. CST4]MDC9550510.1 putative metalloprotea